jgi:hydrogenase/urease accessory protein HupE
LSHNRLRARLLAALLLGVVSTLGAPAPAAAHLVSTGLGPFYDGIGHLALTPDDLLSVLALAMLAGLRGKGHARAALLALTASWFLGGMLGLAYPRDTAGIATVAGMGSLLVLGALLAADLTWSRHTTVALTATVGAVHGFVNGGALASSGGALGIAGIVAAALVLATLTAACVTSSSAAWTRIAVRVVGSWIAAVGLLMFGWWSRGAL